MGTGSLTALAVDGGPVSSAREAFLALDANKDWDLYLAVMKVPCPWCKARCFAPCTSDGIPLAKGSRLHPSREALAGSRGPQ